MPRIRTFTAEGGPGVLPANQTSPDSFGAQAFQGITQLGRGFTEPGQKIQHNQDQLDLLKISSQYEIQLDQAKAEIANHPDLDRHGEMLQAVNDKIQANLIKANPTISSAVETAFQNHAIKQYTNAAVELAGQGRKIAVERQLVDLQSRAEMLVDTQAMVQPGDAFGRDTGHRPGQVRGTVDHLISSFTNNGTLHPKAAEKLRDDLNHRYWEQRATEFPEHVMEVVASGKLGFDDFNMDQAKAAHYNAIAVNVLNQRQALADRAEKEAEKAIKRSQEVNAAAVTADIIEGKSPALAPLIRSRALDDNVGRTLQELQTKMSKEQDPSKYQRGLAPQIEASLTQQKYDNKPLDPALADGLTADLMADRITKDEYGHLMGVLRSVDDYKHQKGHESDNDNVSHAHSNLRVDLATTGPADKYDALAGQTWEAADKMFWAEMNKNPQADPWQVADKVSKVFKPVIEKRLGLSKSDKAELDEARITGMVHTKTISPAAAKALRAQKQEDEGRRIVQETLKNLPPPPPPGYFERLQQMNPFKKKEAERKAPGVMGQ